MKLFVMDGHTDYYGENDYKTSSTAKYEAITIAKQFQIQNNLKWI